MTITPSEGYLVLAPQQKAQSVTASGIIVDLPESQAPGRGVVHQAPADLAHLLGKTVCFDPLTARTVEHGGEAYRVIPSVSVYATLD